jgi:hypothetical protein
MRSATGYSQIADADAHPGSYERPTTASATGPPPAPRSPARSSYPASHGNGASPASNSARQGGKPTAEAVSEVLYLAAQEPQACGGNGMRAVFKSAAAREQLQNVTKDLRLSAACLGEYLAARGCSLPTRALESTMATFGDVADGLSFSQFMRMMAEASPTRE